MLTIDTARIFEPLLQSSRYKGPWGGRGSGKSHYMAGAVVEYCLLNPSSRIVCIREVQKTLAQSAKLLIENKIQEFGVGSQFRILYDRIETPGGGLIIFQGMVDATAKASSLLRATTSPGSKRLRHSPTAASLFYIRRSALKVLRFGFRGIRGGRAMQSINSCAARDRTTPSW